MTAGFTISLLAFMPFLGEMALEIELVDSQAEHKSIRIPLPAEKTCEKMGKVGEHDFVDVALMEEGGTAKASSKYFAYTNPYSYTQDSTCQDAIQPASSFTVRHSLLSVSFPFILLHTFFLHTKKIL
jgi:hypothetical protein